MTEAQRGWYREMAAHFGDLALAAYAEGFEWFGQQHARVAGTFARLALAPEPSDDAYASPIAQALTLALDYGSIDGDHHKMWVIDQMVRLLAGAEYERLIMDFNNGEDGPETYHWDEGIVP